MKFLILLLFIVVLGLLAVPAFAQVTTKGLNHPGLKWDWPIQAENYTFHVTTVSNYDITNVTFNKANKEIVFIGNSSYADKIAEIEIPTNLIGGNLTVTEDGKPVSAIVVLGTNSSTVMLKLNKTGVMHTSVIGTTYLPEFSSIVPLVMVMSVAMVLLVPRLRKF